MNKGFLLSFITLFSFFNTQAQDTYWPTDVSEINTGTNSTYLIQSANLDGASVIFGYVLGAFFVNDEGNLQCGGFTNCGSNSVQLAVMGDDTTTEAKDGFYEGEEITWLAYGTFAEQTYTATANFTLTPPFGSNTFSTNGLNIITDFNISSAVLGCMVDAACNYNANATKEDNSCTYAEENYNCDGSCIDIDGDLVCDIYEILGCTDLTAFSYNPGATEEDGSCEYPVGLSPVSPLFFSEYAESSSNNKYLEIYNPTDSVVSLDAYAFPSVSNAPDSIGEYEYWNAFTEGASIAPGDVYVIAHGSSDSLILAHADQTHTYLSTGDDGYALAFGTEDEYVILDFIGDFNADPGSGWDVAGITEATKDHTLLRKFSITAGNTDWTVSAGMTAEDSEWIVLENEVWTYLGSHTDLVFVYGCTDTIANNYNMEATMDDGSCTYDGIAGCTDSTATNYNPEAIQDDGSCEYEAMEVTISQIQGTGDASPYVDQFVSTSGVVTAVAPQGYFIQETSAAWSGVYVYDTLSMPLVGNTVSFDAEVVEYYGMTELKNVTNFMVLMEPSEAITPLTNISAPLTENLEGCLITLEGMCTAVANSYGEATFVNTSLDGQSFVTNDLIYGHDFTLNEAYQITGVIEYNFDEYKLCPRNAADVSMLISVEEITALNTKIYMNDASLFINSELDGVQVFEVYAINGQRVLYGQFDGQLQLSVSMLNDGIYLVKVANHVQKVVKF